MPDDLRMPRYAMRLAYDGTAFHGWWRQNGQRSVAGCLDQAFLRIGEAKAAPVGAARTDAGVHAAGQVAHVDAIREWPMPRLLATLNGQLPEDLVCTGIAPVDSDWHACHLARGKTYGYRIDDRAIPDPFQMRWCWRTPFRLDLDTLQRVARNIPGRRDWRGFSRRGEYRENLERHIESLTWERDQHGLRCRVSGDGFTYHLVRSLVGACVAVANGTCHEDALAASLAGEASPAGRQQAPARGLILERVHYASEPDWKLATE